MKKAKIVIFSLVLLVTTATPGFCQSVLDTPITVKVTDKELAKSLHDISNTNKVPMVIYQGFGKIQATFRFEDMKLGEAMSYLARTYNFSWCEKNGAIIVGPKNSITTPKTFTVGDPAKAKRILATFIPKDRLVIDEQSGTITINADTEDMKNAELALQAIQ